MEQIDDKAVSEQVLIPPLLSMPNEILDNVFSNICDLGILGGCILTQKNGVKREVLILDMSSHLDVKFRGRDPTWAVTPMGVLQHILATSAATEKNILGVSSGVALAYRAWRAQKMYRVLTKYRTQVQNLVRLMMATHDVAGEQLLMKANTIPNGGWRVELASHCKTVHCTSCHYPYTSYHSNYKGPCSHQRIEQPVYMLDSPDCTRKASGETSWQLKTWVEKWYDHGAHKLEHVKYQRPRQMPSGFDPEQIANDLEGAQLELVPHEGLTDPFPGACIFLKLGHQQ